MQVITFSFILASDGSKKEIKFNSNTPFGLIRRRVAQEFKLPVSSFRLFCKATKSFVETYEDEEDGYSEDVTWYENGRNRADALIEQMKKVGKLNMDNWTKQ